MSDFVGEPATPRHEALRDPSATVSPWTRWTGGVPSSLDAMALELIDIKKHFGAVRANDGITLHVEAGTLHGLLGENGAGKSTLMKILSGFLKADAGTIRLDGTTLALGSPQAAIDAGIGMLHQDPLVFPPLTVLDNFLLGSPGRGLDRAAGAEELGEISSRLGFHFDPNAIVRTLTVGERQQLEITRLLWLGARLLIFDEPTTGISTSQRVELFATLRRLAADGLIVIFVSHKLEEIEELCDSVTVIRHGKVVGEVDMPVPTDRLVEMMFGEVVVEGDRPHVEMGSPALDIADVTITEGTTAIREWSLQTAAGEVIGLAGLEGSGQRTLLRALAGLVKVGSGRISVAGTDITTMSYRDRLRRGIHYLPAGRLEEGLVSGLTITEHLILAGERDAFFLDWDTATAHATDKIDGHQIKGRPQSTAESLSGGNQQRLLLAMMPPTLELLLMEHPTRGLDIESAEYVWNRILARRSDGTTIVFASADLDELLRYSDRIVVFFSGEVFRVVPAAELDGDGLGYLIGGKERV